MRRLALDMLIGDRSRYLGIVAGVAIAAFLIGQQLAMLNGILDRITATVTNVPGVEIWVMDPKVQYAEDAKPMVDAQLARVRGVAGVAWAAALFKGTLRVRLDDGNFQSAVVNGLDDATLVGGPADMVAGRLSDLRQSGGVIVDEDGANSKLAQRDPAGRPRPLRIGSTLELNDRRAVVVGICKAVKTFQSQPVIFTTYTRAATFAPAERKRLSFILVKAKPGEDPARVAGRIRRHTGLSAYTAAEFTGITRQYFIRETGIIGTFLAGIAISFFVGTVIAGQTLYNFTLENLRQFGAIKAMGASNWAVVSMILAQAAMVGILGLGIGLGGAATLAWAARGTELNLRFSTLQIGLTATAVMVIAGLAAGLASRKVIRLDPAVVFKG
ncbi:MAG: ABC transporter permease [Bryobacteraceae bacterium]|nr:ABC transporter permease [Bryobacteraceae bacterium]